MYYFDGQEFFRKHTQTNLLNNWNQLHLALIASKRFYGYDLTNVPGGPIILSARDQSSSHEGREYKSNWQLG